MFAFPFGVGALEVFYAVFFEVAESGGHFVDEVVIVWGPLRLTNSISKLLEGRGPSLKAAIKFDAMSSGA